MRDKKWAWPEWWAHPPSWANLSPQIINTLARSDGSTQSKQDNEFAKELLAQTKGSTFFS